MHRAYRLIYTCALAFGLLIWADIAGAGTAPASAQGGCSAPNFAPVINFTVGDAPTAMTAGDFNGDGHIDLATANLNMSQVSVLLGNGAGGFTGPVNFPAGLGPNSIGVADFNGDGKSDLVVANQSPNPGAPAHSVSILTGAGDGTFLAPADFAAGRFPRGLVVSDFTGDGKADVAVANSESNEIRVLPGTGTGSLGAPVVTTSSLTGFSGVFELAVGDFNGDGKSDLVGPRENTSATPIGPGSLTVFLGTGTGGFTAGDSRTVGFNPSFVAVGSLNADAFSDLAVVNRASATVSVLFGAGDGTFSPVQSLNAGGIPESAAVADFNLDGRNDLAIPRQSSINSGDVSVFLGDGAGGFSAAGNFAIGTVPFDVVTADFNEDGKSDLATANFTSNNVSVLLNGCGGGSAQTTLQFEHPAHVRFEEQTFLTLTVTRTGGTSGAASVSYATTDGTASERKDYTAALGRLRFAAGETSKTFEIVITDDAFSENAETFAVALGDPVGATLGAPSTTTVTINSNDATNGPSPVRDASFNTEFFVRQHYADFLNRVPDAGGLAFWMGGIDSCGADAQCREVKKIDTSAAFFLSIEFQETGFLAVRTHKAAFGDLAGKPVPLTLRSFLADSRQLADDVVVGTPGWPEQLEANKVAYFNEFVTRDAFITVNPLSLTADQYVDGLFNRARILPTQAERNAAIAAFGAGGTAGRAAALRSVAESQTLRQAETNRAFVLMQYFGYLRRDPDDTDFRGIPDPNFEGFNFWLGKLNQFNGNYVDAEMVKAFIQSIEYGDRFGR